MTNYLIPDDPIFKDNKGDPFPYGKKKYTVDEKAAMLKARSKDNYRHGTEIIVGAGAATHQIIEPKFRKAVDKLLNKDKDVVLTRDEIISKYNGSIFKSIGDAKNKVKTLTDKNVQENQFRNLGPKNYELIHGGLKFEIVKKKKQPCQLIITKSKRKA